MMQGGQKLRNLIQSIDLGGVEARFYVGQHEKTHKTVLGGIISLIMFLISGLYGTYIIYQWINGQLLPQIQSTTQVKQFLTFEMLSDKVNIQIHASNSSLDPFDRENNIITPLYMIINSTNFVGPYPLLEHNYSNQGWFKPGVLPNIRLIHNIGNSDHGGQNQIQILYILQKCQTDNFFGYKCANQTVQDQYFQNGLNLIALSIQNQQIQDGLIQDLRKDYYFPLDMEAPLQSQIILKTQHLTIDNGILFPSQDTYDLIQSSEVIAQVTSTDFSKAKFQVDSFFCTLIRLDPFQEQTIQVTPKIGQVFANILSIVQVLFILKYLIFYINERDFENKLINDIIEKMFMDKNKLKNQDCQNKLQKLQKNEMLRKVVLKKLDIFNVYHELIKLESQCRTLLHIDSGSISSQASERKHEELKNFSDPEVIIINSHTPPENTNHVPDFGKGQNRINVASDVNSINKLMNRINEYL